MADGHAAVVLRSGNCATGRIAAAAVSTGTVDNFVGNPCPCAANPRQLGPRLSLHKFSALKSAEKSITCTILTLA